MGLIDCRTRSSIDDFIILVSPYFVDLLPPRQNCYWATRQTGHFVPYKCKINTFKKYFFPSMVNKWNKLEAGKKNSKSLRICKHQLSKNNKLDLLHQLLNCNGHGSVHHCRLRLG